MDEWDKIWEKFDPNHMPIWQWEYLKYMFFLIDTSGADVLKLYAVQAFCFNVQ